MKTNSFIAAIACGLLFSTTARAVPIQVTSEDITDCCDFLSVPPNVDELGIVGVFPDDEAITADAKFTQEVACPDEAVPGIANQLLTITNFTNRYFDNLWYVADPETRFSNVDGRVNGEVAFKIDHVGINNPLVAESINANGIFEPGETWQFIVDGYSNALGLPASAFFSVGLVGLGSGGDTDSSASIIATPMSVPEPTACLLMSLGLTLLALRRR
jgi:hypothetical protein